MPRSAEVVAPLPARGRARVQAALGSVRRLPLYIVVGLGAVLMVLPFYWMVVTAVSPAPDIIAFPPKWIPSRITWEHFQEAWVKAPWLTYYKNSLVVATVSVGLSVLFGLFAGYAFAVYDFPLQNVLFLVILGTLMVPVQVTSVALYVFLSRIGWVDTYPGILAPNFASAFGVYMIRQAIKAVPMDLIDAARIDGAGEARIVATVVLPLIKPTVAAVAMLLFLSSWNDFLWPVIVINSVSLRTLPVGIALFKDPYGFINYGPLMAGTVITIGPMLLAYAFSQRFMIRGIALTGLR
ncbi:MAG: carbohydrate ABC transporter permease [Armatimonadota bacterium]|nr:carbohydrate ABC transporter permease [Armatimonadota bacterium]MDR7428301.1 carbohydrate ABC transporter permease [Armatimonadota bacterium]MDR7463412.1 carbohydrate ABC transporter permease [Armatimonadota bacterium]MDR7470217.1 carbohydrate ABC transporter permease [Armatimonadota bacterium]MDR7475569.1 carbohydrate ABC transporter permease [Armatimonadota bacterium]